MTPAERFVAEVKRRWPDEPHAALDRILGEMSACELAGLFHAWDEFWARPEQIIPRRPWRMRFYVGARRSGKTRANAEWIQVEVQNYPHAQIILLAQNEPKAYDIFVTGKSGLIETSPPWNRAIWEPSTSTIKWANGATARILTPERPENIRGDGWTHAFATEMQSWPRATREQAWVNLQIATSAPPAKIVGDCTPPRRGRHPILDDLLAREKEDPERNMVLHASIEDNMRNLADGLVADLRRNIVGAQARAELDGVYDPNVDGALFDQEWIDDNRIDAPEKLTRRVLAIDPAIGSDETNDLTGIVDAGLTPDDRVAVFADLSARHPWHRWGELALDRYVALAYDLIVVETNRGGSACVANLRAAAKDRGLRIVVVDPKWRPHRVPGVIFVREVTSRGPKAERAGPVATLYEAGKVAHVRGAPLVALERMQTSWVPPAEGQRTGARRSPDAMDALVMAVVELTGVARPTPADRSADAAAIAAARRAPAPRPGPTHAPVAPRRGSLGRVL